MKKFIVNKMYYTTSIGDHNCVYSFLITKRTEKNVWVSEYSQKPKRRKIYFNNDDREFIFPDGIYSMCPVIHADKTKFPKTDFN